MEFVRLPALLMCREEQAATLSLWRVGLLSLRRVGPLLLFHPVDWTVGSSVARTLCGNKSMSMESLDMYGGVVKSAQGRSA